MMLKGDIGGNPDMGSLYSLDTSEADLSSEAEFNPECEQVFFGMLYLIWKTTSKMGKGSSDGCVLLHLQYL